MRDVVSARRPRALHARPQLHQQRRKQARRVRAAAVVPHVDDERQAGEDLRPGRGRRRGERGGLREGSGLRRGGRGRGAVERHALLRAQRARRPQRRLRGAGGGAGAGARAWALGRRRSEDRVVARCLRQLRLRRGGPEPRRRERRLDVEAPRGGRVQVRDAERRAAPRLRG